MMREPAWRIFAHEFNMSDLQYGEDADDRPSASTYIISPTGAKINRLFVVGVATEVENIGKGEGLWRVRIADPTGVFNVYAGQYQPDVAAFLAELEVPQFIAVVGKARLFKPNETSSYASVRPKEITITTKDVRNNWIITTAERTLDRLEALKVAQRSGLHGDELRETLLRNGTPIALAEGVVMAVEHYDVRDILKDIAKAVESAINTVVPASEFKPASVSKKREFEAETGRTKIVDDGEIELGGEQSEDVTSETVNAQTEGLKVNKDLVMDALTVLDNGSGVPYDELIEYLRAKGLSEDEVEEGARDLMDDGKCYEPKIGILKLI
jgi:RPA family protein